MAEVLEPLLIEIDNVTLGAATLTPRNIDLDLERTRLGAMVYGVVSAFLPSTNTDADDRSTVLIGRPDYAVVSAVDFDEGFGDPDFIVGRHKSMRLTTSGMIDGIYSLEAYLPPNAGGYLNTRRMSLLLFEDNAVQVRSAIYYKLAFLTTKEIERFFFERR